MPDGGGPRAVPRHRASDVRDVAHLPSTSKNEDHDVAQADDPRPGAVGQQGAGPGRLQRPPDQGRRGLRRPPDPLGAADPELRPGARGEPDSGQPPRPTHRRARGRQAVPHGSRGRPAPGAPRPARGQGQRHGRPRCAGGLRRAAAGGHGLARERPVQHGREEGRPEVRRATGRAGRRLRQRCLRDLPPRRGLDGRRPRAVPPRTPGHRLPGREGAPDPRDPPRPAQEAR